MDITKFNIREVHISTIKHGDTIIHTDGLVTTVGRKNITTGFCGIALFGDSYNLGIIKVRKVLI